LLNSPSPVSGLFTVITLALAGCQAAEPKAPVQDPVRRITTEVQALVCPATEMELAPGAPDWDTEIDGPAFRKATVRCAELYPNSPCLVQFVKTGELAYWAVCGTANGGEQ
jgi:hypothetical protein